MRIKKNGTIINLNEEDIKKIGKSFEYKKIKEETQEDIDLQDSVIHNDLEGQLRSLQVQVNNNTELIKNLYGWMYTDANRK